MKGIILAGGSGTRLDPLTRVVSKQLLPIYNKPMVHYPLSTLILAGATEVLVISTPRDLPLYQDLLGDGSSIGLSISYAEQAQPNGLAEAFLIGKDFIAGDPVMMILGDNLFFGQGLSGTLQSAVEKNRGATVFGYYVRDPRRYGVVALGPDGEVEDIVEKPADPPSPYAVTGLYMYDGTVSKRAARLEPSARGELEITDLNKSYLDDGALDLVQLGRGTAWLDTGTHDALLDASNFIASIEHRQGLRVGCIEEAAYRAGRIDKKQLLALADAAVESGLGDYLRSIAD